MKERTMVIVDVVLLMVAFVIAFLLTGCRSVRVVEREVEIGRAHV